MPSTIVKMPQLGESIAEGTIGRWLKQPGERIERDEPLVEVQTDKVNAEVPSPVSGVLEKILQPEGSTIAVQTEIAVIGDGSGADADAAGSAATPEPAAAGAPAHGVPDRGESVESRANLSQTHPAAQGPRGVNEARPPQAAPASAPPPVTAPPTFTYDDAPGRGGVVSSAAEEAEPAEVAPGNGAGKRFYTPVVMRMAQEHAIDLESVPGTGLGGRVTRKDLERYLAERATRPQAASQSAAAGATAPAAPARGEPVEARAGVPAPLSPEHSALSTPVPLTPMRRAIAQHMTRARSEIADAWCMIEMDATNLVRLRERTLPDFQAREGFELTFLPFFAQAVLAGLRAVPELNATWQGDGITLHRQYHLGIAVSLEQGLVVPVLRNADQYSTVGLARALRALVQKARAGKLTPDDLQGATFTVNNPGTLGSIMSQPIVPVGQAGIITMEAIVKRPVVLDNDAIAVRSMMNSCLSFDHRILDGAQALRFLRVVKQLIEKAEFQL